MHASIGDPLLQTSFERCLAVVSVKQELGLSLPPRSQRSDSGQSAKTASTRAMPAQRCIHTVWYLSHMSVAFEISCPFEGDNFTFFKAGFLALMVGLA